MTSNRLEAFSDGVLAIVITIMVLELKTPQETTFESLLMDAPIFLSYILSFLYIGIYWNNHHHLFQVTEKINGKILWSNLHLLFWLSLIPFATSWIGENYDEAAPVAVYGIVLLMSAIAYSVLKRQIMKNHSENFDLRDAMGKNWKEKISILLYVAGIIAAFIYTEASIICFVVVAVIWFIPERRIEELAENNN